MEEKSDTFLRKSAKQKKAGVPTPKRTLQRIISHRVPDITKIKATSYIPSGTHKGTEKNNWEGLA